MSAPAVIREPSHVPLVHVMRGALVEGTHHGSVVVLDPDGGERFTAGDADAACYPRSALKPLHTLAMLRAGLVLDDDLLALSAGSHAGEEFHLAGVRRILAGTTLTPSDLRNPAALPLDPMVRDRWIRHGWQPSPLAHNCSGNHAAMLLTAYRRGWSTADYTDPDHPLQRAIAETVADLTGEPIAYVAVDGCGAPALSVSLRGLTRAIGRIGAAPEDSPEGQVAWAIRRYPEMVAGSRRDVTHLMRAVPRLIVKDGFEAVQVAALPDGRAVGVKIADGSVRARLPVTLAALARCGVDRARLAAFTGASGWDREPDLDLLRVTGDLAADAMDVRADPTPAPGQRPGAPADTPTGGAAPAAAGAVA